MKADVKLSLTFLIQLVLGIILAVAIASCAAKVAKTTNEARSSFSKLAQNMNEVNGEGELASFALTMDKASVIVGFSKGEDYALRTFHTGTIVGDYQNKYLRKDFSACSDLTTSCLCLAGEHAFVEESEILQMPKANTRVMCSTFSSALSFPCTNCNGVMLYKPDDQQRRHTVYIERKKETLYLCQSLPCAP